MPECPVFDRFEGIATKISSSADWESTRHASTTRKLSKHLVDELCLFWAKEVSRGSGIFESWLGSGSICDRIQIGWGLALSRA